MKIHVVRKEESMSEVAEKYGVDEEVLLAANPQIESRNTLAIGTKIRIPSKGQGSVEKTSNLQESSSLQDRLSVQINSLQKGSEELSDEMLEDTSDPTYRQEGERGPSYQEAQVQPASADVDRSSDRSSFPDPGLPYHKWGYQEHEVRPGETLWQIAQAYQVGLPELLMVNPQIEDPDQINVGDIVRIPPRSWHPFPWMPPAAVPGRFSPGVPGLPSMPMPPEPFHHIPPMMPGMPEKPMLQMSKPPMPMSQMPMPTGIPPFPVTPYWYEPEHDPESKEGKWMPVTIWVPYSPYFHLSPFSPYGGYSMP